MKKLIQTFSVLALSVLVTNVAHADETVPKLRSDVVKTRYSAKPQDVNAPTDKKQRVKTKAKRSNATNSGLMQEAKDRVKVARPVQNVIPVSVPQPLPKIYGCIEYSGSRDNIDHTVCAIPTNDNERFEVIIQDVNAIDGGTAVDGVYYGAYHTEYYGEYQLYINGYDITTGKRTAQALGDSSAEATDVAYNPVDGKVYGCFCDPDSEDYSDYYFGTIDYTTGKTTRISDFPRQMAAMAIDAAGKIYVIDKQQEKVGYTLTTVAADLYTVDAATGEMTFIGKTGLKPEYRTSACIDPLSGRMFYTLSPEDEYGYLYEIDTKTGAATLIYTFPGDEEVVGLYIPDGGVTADSPAAVSNLSVSFPNGSTEGSLTFTLPATDINGTAISGVLSYVALANGSKIGEGTGACGDVINLPVRLPSEGLYNFSVSASNDSGSSPEATLSVYIGHDTPMAPEVDVRLLEQGINVSWNAVTTAVNGGYIDPAKVSYRVTRYPGAVTVADNLTQTSFTDRMDIPDAMAYYYYTVEASADGKTSQPGRSSKIIVGQIIPPYTDDFNDINTFDYFTVIDANNDNTTWGPYIGNIRVSFSDDRQMAMDDWLITPPVSLEAGKAYRFSIDVLTGNANANEAFEVKWGLGNSVADMTGTVIEKMSVAHTDYVTYHGFIVPEVSGKHYIGIHGCSEPDMYTLTIDNLAIDGGVLSGVPAEPAGLQAESYTDGHLMATVSVTVPETDAAGNPLTSIDKLILSRFDDEIKVFTNPKPGDILTYTDEVDACDTYVYNAVAINAVGDSPVASVSVYIGVLEPSDPTNVMIVETGTVGEVKISWNAPATDIKGNALAQEFIKYRIYRPNGSTMDVVQANITETSCVLKVLEDVSAQAFVQYVVVAETLGGLSDGMPTPMIPVGKAYDTPFRESFSNGKINSILATNTSGGARWQLYNDTEGISACDHDNGFIGSEGKYVGDYGSLTTGKINLEGLANPALTFYTYSITDEVDLDDNEIEVAVVADGETETVSRFVISDITDEEGWIKLLVPLNQYEGKTVQFVFTSYLRTFTYTFIDCIRVDNMTDHNLTVNRITAPESVKAGMPFDIVAEIENNGLESVGEYSVDLYLDGEKIESKKGAPVESYAKMLYSFRYTIPVTDIRPHSFKVVAVYAEDELTDDNTSDELVITPVAPTLPRVGNAEAVMSADNNGVVLSWTEPDMAEYIPDPSTDGFEDYASWATTGVGEWIFVDRDGAKIGGFSDGTAFPGIAPGTVQSFWVMDCTEEGFNNYFFESHSGSKYIAQMFSYLNSEPAVCDDWAISPELYGGEQTVSLFARGVDNSYAETFEILWSEGSTNPDDFKVAGQYTAQSNEWVCFNCKLPDGARRFAIRCTSNFKYMLLVDDVTFIHAPAEGELALTGFNVYRNGRYIGSASASERSFTDSEGAATDSYLITAVYDKGESAPTAEIKVDSSIFNAFGASVTVNSGRGTITVAGAEGKAIDVVSPDGRVVAVIGKASESEVIAVAPGIYMVSVDATVTKVAVR